MEPRQTELQGHAQTRQLQPPGQQSRPEPPRTDSNESTSSEDNYSISLTHRYHDASFDTDLNTGAYTPGGTLDATTPLTDLTTSPAWSGVLPITRNRQNSGSATDLSASSAQQAIATSNVNKAGSTPKAVRPPGPARHVSNTYQPNRTPKQKHGSTGGLPHHAPSRHRSYSASREARAARRDPNAQYRAQEKAYIQQLRQDPTQDWTDQEPYTPSIGTSNDSELEEESQSSEAQLDPDMYEPEAQLFLHSNAEELSANELSMPHNRERLEWHCMLASVLKGDVVKQEKQRLIGSTEQKGEKSWNHELWLQLRAKVCGRGLSAQRRLIEQGRTDIVQVIEKIIAFQVKGGLEAGKPAAEQVLDVVQQIEKCESLFPTRQALGQAIERAASDAFIESSEAVISWHNTIVLINTELAVLRSWVGNDELDFSATRTVGQERSSKHGNDGSDDNSVTGGTNNHASKNDFSSPLNDNSTFLDRLNKDDTLVSLQGDDHGKHSMLLPVAEVIRKAKETLIQNAQRFANRHLPPYIEELLTLINFPSRLIQEIIRMRLRYVTKMKDLASLEPLMQAQMIQQFRILLKLAVRIKQDYTIIAQPEPGWELPPCIDENFDFVVLEALQFYFKMLNGKLVGNRNTFKEAEILEQEWEFCNDIGRYLDGGDIEVAEQFSGLTAKALQRLTSHFERELTRKPEQTAGETDRRYKQILDSVRVRQRKLFRFSRLLSQRFENATEFNISLDEESISRLYDALMETGHVLLQSPLLTQEGIYLLAPDSVCQTPKAIQSILGTSHYKDEYVLEETTSPYVLMLRPDRPLLWEGKTLDVSVRLPSMDIRPGRLRLVAEGFLQKLQNARTTFLQTTGLDLAILTEMRANLPRVNMELSKIKRTAYKLSNTIMESVQIIRELTQGFENQELIQTCFAFATEFGKRSVTYMDANRRMMNNLKLTRLALDWVSFICDDCIASDRKTFRWAVVALEFAMVMTQGLNVLSLSDEEFTRLRTKVAGCMSLLISHFDIMGAKSTLAAQAEKQRVEALASQLRKMDISGMKDDVEASRIVRDQWLARLEEVEEIRRAKVAERQAIGRVMENINDADRSLTFLSSSATNVTMRWQLGQFVGGGTFGSVYAAFNIDSGSLMAVKEIRLQDPQMIPTVAGQIRDEQAVLEVLDHPNIVSYYGIEVHRDKVYIFMEYCSGGSLASLLEHGRIEDETVLQVYALQMLEGLAYLHQAGIAHRDIKPENILLDHNGVIKYVDFGAAKVIARQNKTLQPDTVPVNCGTAGPGAKAPAKQKSMTGTPMYMSPEVIKGSNEGRLGSTDVWSLGCVVLEMATGRRPWASLDNEWAIMYNIAQGNPPQLPSKDQLSPGGIDFLMRCFERDPRRRATAAELLQCEWINFIKAQVVPSADLASPFDRSSSSSSSIGSRQNSAQF